MKCHFSSEELTFSLSNTNVFLLADIPRKGLTSVGEEWLLNNSRSMGKTGNIQAK